MSLETLKTVDFVFLQGIHCLSCVLPVITAMACPAGTSAGRRGPDPVLCTLTEPQLEQAARPTACPALLVRTVTAQVWQTAPRPTAAFFIR